MKNDPGENKQPQTGEQHPPPPEHIHSCVQAVLDAFDTMVVILDERGTICLTNNAWKERAAERCAPSQLGRTDIGTNYLEVYQRALSFATQQEQKELLEAFSAIQEVLAGTRSVFTQEYQCSTPMQCFWYMMHVTSFPPSKGAIISHIDMTELAERKQLDQQKDLLLSLASHELRTPLTTLKGLLQIEKKKMEKQQQVESSQHFACMESQVDLLIRFILEVLDVSKLQAGKLEYAEQPLDLDTLLKDIVQMVQRSTPSHHLNLQGASYGSLWADRSKITEVFTNLLINAVNYSPETDRVDITVQTLKGMALIKIQDYGFGIAEEHLHKYLNVFIALTIARNIGMYRDSV